MSRSTASTSPSLLGFPQQLRAARAGDRDLLGRLFASCHKRLAAAACSALQGDRVAQNSLDDLLQETYLQAIRDLESFRGNCANEWFGWLRGILRHRIADLRRARPIGLKPLTAADEPADWKTGSAEFRTSETTAQVQSALAKLTQEQKEALLLRAGGECQWQSIGAQQGRTRDAARMLYVRAAKKLLKFLSPPNRPDECKSLLAA